MDTSLFLLKNRWFGMNCAVVISLFKDLEDDLIKLPMFLQLPVSNIVIKKYQIASSYKLDLTPEPSRGGPRPLFVWVVGRPCWDWEKVFSPWGGRGPLHVGCGWPFTCTIRVHQQATSQNAGLVIQVVQMGQEVQGPEPAPALCTSGTLSLPHVPWPA